jgi:ABC-type dipeptide/oligopeptide/nickel transport system permease component|tara:strand:- start:5204 stop:6508 length:1305 start_codon:yes stop_codon:yes gene_type:complete
LISYLLKKLGYGLLVLLGVVSLVFFVFNLKPGDPARMVAGQKITPELIQAIERNLNLDLPIIQRFGIYLNDISPVSIHNEADETSRIFLDESKYSYTKLFPVGGENALVIKAPYLNRSFQSKRSVSSIISQALPGTLILAVVSIVFALIIGVFGGVIAALNKDKWIDKLILILSVIGMSGPSFFMAILVAWIGGLLWFNSIPLPVIPFIIAAGLFVYFLVRENRREASSKLFSMRSVRAVVKAIVIGFGIWLGLVLLVSIFSLGDWVYWSLSLPGTGLDMTGSLYSLDEWEGLYLNPRNLILPALTLGVRPLGVVVQLTRSSLLDILKQDYIRTARAKGLSENKVVYKHALRNALNPVITAVSGWFASMLAGAVFVEFVFGWKGLGLEIFNALEKEDFPVVMGAVLVISFMFVILNILVDVLYGLVDPRVRVRS